MKRKVEIIIEDKRIKVDESVYFYIEELKSTIKEIKQDNRMLKGELKSIKPVFEHKNYKPALSEDCKACKYCVKSSWDGYVIACRKDNVCEDFEEKEK